MVSKRLPLLLFFAGISIVFASAIVLGGALVSLTGTIKDIIYWLFVDALYVGIFLMILPVRKGDLENTRTVRWIKDTLFAIALGTSILAFVGGYFLLYMVNPATGRLYPWESDPYSINRITPLLGLVSIFSFLGGACLHVFGDHVSRNQPASKSSMELPHPGSNIMVQCALHEGFLSSAGYMCKTCGVFYCESCYNRLIGTSKRCCKCGGKLP